MSYEVVRLEECTDLLTCGVAKKPDYVDEGIPFLSSKNVKKDRFILNDYNYISKEQHFQLTKKNKPQKGDLLYSRVGSFGEAAVIDFDMEFSVYVSLTLIKVKKDILFNRYLMHYLNSPSTLFLATNSTTGIGVKNLNVNVVRDFPIPLPPLDIQKKIADTLDKAQELIDKRKEQISALDKFLENLFLDMFGDPVSNPMGWETEKLEKVAPIKASKKIFSSDEYIWNLTLDQIISNSNVVIKKEYKKFEEVSTSTFIFDKTQVLYSKLRPYLNKVIVPDESGVATSELVALNPKILILNQFFLLYLLRNNSFLKFISDKVSGAKMPRVVMDEFKKFDVILPPLDLQNQFASIVEKVQAEKTKLEASLKEMGDNFNSIMQRAFKGELF